MQSIVVDYQNWTQQIKQHQTAREENEARLQVLEQEINQLRWRQRDEKSQKCHQRKVIRNQNVQHSREINQLRRQRANFLIR